MSDKTEMERVRDGFHNVEEGLKALAPLAESALSRSDLAKFRKLKRTIWRAHADAQELAEAVNGGAGGEIVPLGGGS